MQTITFSEAALAMLRLHYEQINIRIDDSNSEVKRTGTRRANGGHPPIRSRAGMVLPIHEGRPRSG